MHLKWFVMSAHSPLLRRDYCPLRSGCEMNIRFAFHSFRRTNGTQNQPTHPPRNYPNEKSLLQNIHLQAFQCFCIESYVNWLRDYIRSQSQHEFPSNGHIWYVLLKSLRKQGMFRESPNKPVFKLGIIKRTGIKHRHMVSLTNFQVATTNLQINTFGHCVRGDTYETCHKD